MVLGVFSLLLQSGNAANLVGWWKFDEGTGTTAADSSGNGCTASLLNGATWSGASVSLDGINDLVSIPDGAWNRAAPLTIAFWYYKTANSGGYFVDHGFTGANAGSFDFSNARFNIYDSTQTNRYLTLTNILSAWTHLAVTITPTEMRAYQNGVLTGTTATISGFPKRSGALYLGGRGETNSLYQGGQIYDLRIYDDALNPDQVRQLCGVKMPSLAWTERSDWINVKTDVSPAAVGDGIADDTAAIQAALNSPGNGQTIYFPPGTYKITNTCTLTNIHTPEGSDIHYGITLIGHGRDTVLRWGGASGTNNSMLTIIGKPYARYVGLTLDGQGVVANGITHENTGTNAKFETNVRYQHMAFYNFTGQGMQATATTATAEISFENCLFDHCGTGVRCPVSNDYNWTIAGCDFIGCGTGINVVSGNAYVRDCYFNGNSSYDIYMSSSHHGNSVRRCKSFGSAQFIYNYSGESQLSVQDCYVAHWTGTNGAITHGADLPLLLANNSFVDPPDTAAPVRITSGTMSRAIICNNAAVQSGTLITQPAGGLTYTVPAGSYPPKVSGTNGANITSFINSSVTVPSAVYDVTNYSTVVGSGTSDDTVAIQNCINDARTAGNGAIAYLPAYTPSSGTNTATYKITSTLSITGSNYRVGGSGFFSRLKWSGTTGGTMVSITDPNNVTLENIMIGHKDIGAMNNSIDVEQTSTGTTSRMNYDGLYVYGKYQVDPENKGLRLNGLGTNCTVVMKWVQGNLRLYNSANATVIGNITYEGGLTVDHTSSTRDGFLGIMTRSTTVLPNNYKLTVRNNNSIVMSDWYNEQGYNGALLLGADGDPAGRVTLVCPKIDFSNNTAGQVLTINNYQGQVFLASSQFYLYPAPPATQTMTQTGSRPVNIVMMGCFFMHCQLADSGTTYNFVGNITSVPPKSPIPADSYTTQTLTDMALAVDDLQHLGTLDLSLNYPFIPLP